MRRRMMKSKIHRATVTDANLHYVGSVTVDEDLLDAADIMEFEQVAIVDVDNGEVWLHNVHIPEYAQGSWTNHSTRRKRKLLLNRAEIDKIERRVSEKGLTIVPLALYFKDGRAKVEIALARGKKSWDKRQTLREKTADREAEAALGRRLKGLRD